MKAQFLSAAAVLALVAFGAQAAPAQPSHKITWDNRSLMIDGKRVAIWSGEFHPFRLPSPDLWRDALQKMKATGYNAVSVYFPWDFYSFAQGKYDFTGVRDIDRLFTIAEEEGMYVIARPGPYANAELTRGGFPGWLVNQKAKARTDDPAYLAAADEWLSQIDPIIARHQATKGGSVIAYQIENELLETTPSHSRYMQHLADKVRDDGITIPLFSNDIGRNGYWVPKSSKVEKTVPGPTDLYAWDSYPGGPCMADGTPGGLHAAPDFGWYSQGGAKGGSSASPNTPGFTSEFGGGWFDFWGSDGLYTCLANRIGSGYERVFYGTNIANGLIIHNVYMAVGGTSWGWLPGPIVFTSYDYGAGIDESLGLRDKAQTMKMIGGFIAATGESLAGMQKSDPVASSNPTIKLYHNANPDDGSHLIVAMHNPSSAVTKDKFSFSLKTRDGAYRIPAEGEIAVNGQDAKMLLADFGFLGQHLVYATSQLQTALKTADGDVALFYAPESEMGEMVLRYASAPKVTVLAGQAQSQFDAKTGDLRLNYTHSGIIRLRIEGGGRAPLTLLIATTEIGKTFWHDGTVLVRGGALLRKAKADGGVLSLEGDNTASETLEVWASKPFSKLTWNGDALTLTKTASGSVETSSLSAPEPVKLPDIWAGTWRFQAGSPEAARDFDDSAWRKADSKGGTSTVKPPLGQPTLTADEYGFYNGDVWYRGRYEGTDAARHVDLTYGAGGAGMMQIWLDGKFLGQHELPTGADRPQTYGTVRFDLPEWARKQGSHVISVMVRNNSHNWDLQADDAHKEGRGLISVALAADTGPRAAVPIAWKIKGLAAPVADTMRGPLNNGGLDGEIKGFHLPGDIDTSWKVAKPDSVPAAPGTYWLRSHFDLDLPNGDVALGLVFGDGKTLRSAQKYRVLIFVNGWNMGQYIAHVGPQRTFVLPQGVLNAHGANTIALAVTSDGDPKNKIEPVHLTVLRNARGGVGPISFSTPSK
ncbi:hypothetical protein FHS83_002462 [Rhizomicrobium palustre]|uniref:beta-galactosidase n=1 Tax=Rhizomicrobium palustre TaxID=189966 RepID=A0A846MZQ0_9PROT|nr:beta-galactosidase [Rhizomicrobium palustre]NIK89144.1 hypothetical protein [Rhizomicrobium palustre]